MASFSRDRRMCLMSSAVIRVVMGVCCASATAATDSESWFSMTSSSLELRVWSSSSTAKFWHCIASCSYSPCSTIHPQLSCTYTVVKAVKVCHRFCTHSQVSALAPEWINERTEYINSSRPLKKFSQPANLTTWLYTQPNFCSVYM